tara:strand:- start:1329 stop:1589 length:261 start_codon:yes stop_codon:yes gene_type:complete
MYKAHKSTCSNFTHVYKSKKKETKKALQDALNIVSYPLKDDIIQRLNSIERKIKIHSKLQDERFEIILNEIKLIQLQKYPNDVNEL